MSWMVLDKTISFNPGRQSHWRQDDEVPIRATNSNLCRQP
jgi:hypothetical protein